MQGCTKGRSKEDKMYLTNFINDVSAINRELNRFLEGGVFQERTTPAIRFHSDPEKFYLQVDLPGYTREEIDVKITNDVLTISGKREAQKGGEGQDLKWLRRERESGEFTRTVELPAEVEAGKVEARMKNGILYLELPISEEKKPRQIEIKAE